MDAGAVWCPPVLKGCPIVMLSLVRNTLDYNDHINLPHKDPLWEIFPGVSFRKFVVPWASLCPELGNRGDWFFVSLEKREEGGGFSYLRWSWCGWLPCRQHTLCCDIWPGPDDSLMISLPTCHRWMTARPPDFYPYESARTPFCPHSLWTPGWPCWSPRCCSWRWLWPPAWRERERERGSGETLLNVHCSVLLKDFFVHTVTVLIFGTVNI